jgi:methyl-accepting chemotaxis protein
MAQQPLSLEIRTSPFPATLRWQGISLRQRIAGGIVGIVAIVGLLVLIIVHQFTGRALWSQLDQQASVIATNLSDAASGLIMGDKILELYALTAKYARLDAISYVFIEDGRGKILTNSLGTLPPELRQSLSSDDRRQAGRRSLVFRGRSVHETRMPILEGRAGVAYVGMWRDLADLEIRRFILPITALISLAIISGIVLAMLLARWIIEPLLGLIVVAERISKGELEAPVNIASGDEIGELARSLERMRVSLKAAMIRLSRA